MAELKKILMKKLYEEDFDFGDDSGSEENNEESEDNTDNTEEDTEDDTEEDKSTEKEDDKKASDNTQSDTILQNIPQKQTDNKLKQQLETLFGINEIEHTTSSTIIEFNDGGQVMYMQPIINLRTETINRIIDLIVSDVEYSYGQLQDEISTNKLNQTKYWKTIKHLIETTVKSQMVQNDNFNLLIAEIKDMFSVLNIDANK